MGSFVHPQGLSYVWLCLADYFLDLWVRQSAFVEATWLALECFYGSCDDEQKNKN